MAIAFSNSMRSHFSLFSMVGAIALLKEKQLNLFLLNGVRWQLSIFQEEYC
ncbi:hypothetical protein [Cylindrospermopsis raciborskii]|uniref:hypothetical protein n=1 Tax=Cylindrospermopsis raciborskii TaxID=77022 RepID=UPI001BAAAB9D|nr:hypothetical protein [Cylindrospermopsis raciborskii]